MSLDLSDISSDSEAGDAGETVPPNTYKLALEEVSYNRDVNAIHIPLQRQKQLVVVDTDRRRKKSKEKKTQNRRRKGGGVTDEVIPTAVEPTDRRSKNFHNKPSNFKILANKKATERHVHRNDLGRDDADEFASRDFYIDPNFNSTDVTEMSSSVFQLNINAQEFVPKFISITNK